MFNLVFSSSATVYGVPQYLPVDEKHGTGGCTSPYGRTKYFLEQMMIDLAAADKVSAAGVEGWGVHHWCSRGGGLGGHHWCSSGGGLGGFIIGITGVDGWGFTIGAAGVEGWGMHHWCSRGGGLGGSSLVQQGWRAGGFIIGAAGVEGWGLHHWYDSKVQFLGSS